MRIGARLHRLERAAAALPDQRCRGCGHLRHRKRGQIDPGIKYRVLRGEPGDPPIEGPDVCADCGALLVIRLAFEKGG